MAEETTAGEQADYTNPFLKEILEVSQNTDGWAKRDRQIQKKRLAERSTKRTKPYPNAPNFVVPIADDLTREKTDQEHTMLLNARTYCYFLPMEPGVPGEVRSQAQAAFDTYLRYLIKIAPKMEEALDTKNSRGFVVIKRVRTEHEELREFFPNVFKPDEQAMFPDIEVRDPLDVIVPVEARREMGRSPWICDIYRFSEHDFDKLCKRNPLCRNVKKIKEKATNDPPHDIKSMFDTVKKAVGLNNEGKGGKKIPIFELFFHANAWTVKQHAKMYRGEDVRKPIEGRKARMLFCPLCPDEPLLIAPWREADTEQVEEVVGEDGAKEYKATVVYGADRPWEYEQARYENRSSLYYDSRGVGQLVMDDQIAASQTRNVKHVLMDFLQLPRYTGKQPNSTQMTHEPGSFIPEGVQIVNPPDISPTLDLTIDGFKREAGRRVGVGGQYEYSDQIAQGKRVQKTATEVTRESMRSDMVSSASVERFILPWSTIFTFLWQDLRRMNLPLPMIEAGDFSGMAPQKVYAPKWLIVPAGSSKTLNPDLQFLREKELWTFLKDHLATMGVELNPLAAARDMVAGLDPAKIKWIAGGGGGQQPVYTALGELAQKVATIEAALQQIQEVAVTAAKLADETAGKVDGETAGQ